MLDLTELTQQHVTLDRQYLEVLLVLGIFGQVVAEARARRAFIVLSQRAQLRLDLVAPGGQSLRSVVG
jgi:hypothetical protein